MDVDAHNSPQIPDSSVLSTKKRQSPVDSIKIRMYSKSKKADQDPFINTKEEQGEVTLQNTTQPTNTDSPEPKVKVIFVMYIWMIIFPSQIL